MARVGLAVLFASASPALPLLAAGSGENTCDLTHFAGNWRPREAGGNMLVRLEIVEKCERMATRLDDAGEAPAGASPWANMLKPDKKYIYREYTLRGYDRCYPADCVLGRQKGQRDEKGVLKTRFKLFWSTRYVEITPAPEGLRVRWKVEYVGRKKPDEFGEMLMVRDD